MDGRVAATVYKKKNNSAVVVIVGGGVAGSLIAKTLQYSADVVLIDPKEYFEIPWACLRAMVEPTFAERSVVNHSDYLTNARIITSTATMVTQDEVMTEHGHVIGYDYLVIATGHNAPIHKTRNERLSHFQDELKKIQSASSILIVGGGPTGVELAAEIAADFPTKKVSLVHRGSRLLEFIGANASRKALKWLTSKNVDVLLGESVDLRDASDGIYRTSGGETISADIHFACTGNASGSSWLRDTFLKNRLDGHGRLMVDEKLRVKGHRNIFGIGDITNIREMKQGYLAQRHAILSARNIKVLVEGGEERKLRTYKGGAEMAIVSLGRRHGVAQFPFVTLIGRIPGFIKSRDLFVGKTRNQLGLL